MSGSERRTQRLEQAINSLLRATDDIRTITRECGVALAESIVDARQEARAALSQPIDDDDY